MLLHIYLLTTFVLLANSLERDSSCTTPNGENGTCIPIKSCQIIVQSIAYLDPAAIEFAQQSQCGYDKDPLVCCGSTGKSTTPAPLPAKIIPTLPPNKPTFPNPIENTLLPDSTLCGIQYKSDRIVGGTMAEIDEFPWMAALLYNKDNGEDGGYRCSGTLINQNYILTAASCLRIKGYTLCQVRLGETRFSTEPDCSEIDKAYCSEPAINMNIEEIIFHPYYSQRSGNNDIALIRLANKVNYTEFVRPICLPPTNYPAPRPGAIMEISGWGVTENGSRSDVKLKVNVPMTGNSACSVVFPNYTHINPNQACAGGEEGKDACFGDAGGPLMRKFEFDTDSGEQQWFQEGIIYRGVACGLKGVPSLYTRVSRYISWIVNTLEN